MNLNRSIRALGVISSDTRAFHALGLPLLWYLRFHYEGRWYDRRAKVLPEEEIEFEYRGKRLRFVISATYAGTLAGVFLDDEYSLNGLLKSSPARILDLGANIGMAAAALSCQFPAAEFVMVEPDPRNVKRLENTVLSNNLNGQIVGCAVAARPGRLLLHIGRNPTCSRLETSHMHHSLADTVEVETLTVEQVLSNACWDKVDLVKIDIEGTEEELLTENNSWLECVGALVLEIHPTCNQEKISGVLRGFGFHLRRHGTGREPVYIATRSKKNRRG
jgi:FkbM family methyltransferase